MHELNENFQFTGCVKNCFNSTFAIMKKACMLSGKNILVAGIGSAQTDLIAHFKKMGHHVIGISYRKEGRALTIVDEFEEIDIIDKVKVLNYARSKNIDLFYSIGSDLAMPTIGYVSTNLNLPTFVNEDIASITLNKVLLRKFLHHNNLSTIEYTSASTIHDLSNWSIFPAIIKPVDSQGQRGVCKVSDRDELKTMFYNALNFSLSKTIIVEQFIEGREISVNGYMYNGTMVYAFISDRRVVDGFSGGLVKGHDFPSQMPYDLQLKARKLAAEVAQKLKYNNGPIYFQLIYTNNDVFIIEAALRFDGCHLWKLIKKRYGIDLLDIAVNHLLGMNPEFPVVKEPSNRSDSIDFFVMPPGTLFKLIDYPQATNDYNNTEMYFADGEFIRPINGVMEKVGYQLITKTSCNETGTV